MAPPFMILGSLPPGVTPRARARAPVVVEYAAATGAAALVSPAGRVVLAAGEPTGLDFARIGRAARRLGAERGYVSFRASGWCMHATLVQGGWLLCVAASPAVAPLVVAERARKAAYVLALALADGAPPGSPGSPSGTSAAVATPPKPRGLTHGAS